MSTSENRASLVLEAVEAATPMLRRFARNHCLDLEDLQQEAAIFTLECLDKALACERPRAFIHRVIRNRTVDLIRRRLALHVLSLDMPMPYDDHVPLKPLSGPLSETLAAPTTRRDEVRQDAIIETVHTALHRLPTDEQIVIASVHALNAFIPRQGVPLDKRASTTRTRRDYRLGAVAKLRRNKDLRATVESMR